MFAALIAAGPAFAGEVAAGAPVAPWRQLTADNGAAGIWQSPVRFRGLAGLELVLRAPDDGAPSRGLFFRAGGGLRIGARGSFDPGSGDLRAIFALRLDF